MLLSREAIELVSKRHGEARQTQKRRDDKKNTQYRLRLDNRIEKSEKFIASAGKLFSTNNVSDVELMKQERVWAYLEHYSTVAGSDATVMPTLTIGFGKYQTFRNADGTTVMETVKERGTEVTRVKNSRYIRRIDIFNAAWNKRRAYQSGKVRDNKIDVINDTFVLFAKYLSYGTDHKGNYGAMVESPDGVRTLLLFPTLIRLLLFCVHKATKTMIEEAKATQNITGTAEGCFAGYVDKKTGTVSMTPTFLSNETNRALSTMKSKDRQIMQWELNQGIVTDGKPTYPSDSITRKTLGYGHAAVKTAWAEFTHRVTENV